jgi:membrane protease YdiL (CAAX protease family)
MNPFGALLVSVTAGIGEELLVRGLLQPPFGLIMPNLAFAARHASRYGWDGLLTVWVLGVALGALRSRTDTTTAMFAHAAYDSTTLVALSGLL